MQIISTQYGDLIPQHTDDDLRKREILPMEYHPSGSIKSVPLERQTTIVTQAGELPAELISFHENGVINRIFPLNGKLSGYWSQEDEAGLAEPITLISPIGVLTAKFLSVSFYENQSIRSVTLWPGETLSVPTPVGVIETRIGISFTRDGKVRSLEPAKPTLVKTLAGEMAAFDPDVVGVNGDANSLAFDESGEVCQVITTLTKLKVITPDGHTQGFTPEYRDSLCGDTDKEVVPMKVRFNEREVTVQITPDAGALHLPRAGHVFLAEPYLPQLTHPFGTLRCSI
ncbi:MULTISPECIES: hypothetical protein [unclassified Pseudodesulfovibrio]|uniref:hypothetical protein n=1 Tax=unclassified Pseudodesulfovibrio TaxID=2661612 RepID=UPI000FEB6F9E|nr:MULTISPECIES: hypothetical protein [unclassified Pseudodesulfovibrio]MCJ2163487.1 hypothetical protein [Pseudodesulfovibrio sp. S3-i]RWU06722.1 hypothetical protein DWB63_02880 [Pseudodesulfovibrio sp. S3]